VLARALIGRCTYIPDNFGPANVNQHVCIIRTGYWILPQYLSSYLNSQSGQSQILWAQIGVTREGLNYTQLRALLIPLAPLEEQRHVVARIQELFELTKQFEESIGSGRKRTDILEQTILARAFRGELVHRDPKDEPITTILERIKNYRSNMKKVRKPHTHAHTNSCK